MSGIIGESLPLYYPEKENKTGASETTPGETVSTRWVVVATHLNPGEAAVIKARLESYGIPALAQQEAIGSVLGLTVGPLGSARVLTPEPLAERALAILAESFEADEGEEGEV
jgi:hypothetical protein